MLPQKNAHVTVTISLFLMTMAMNVSVTAVTSHQASTNVSDVTLKIHSSDSSSMISVTVRMVLSSTKTLVTAPVTKMNILSLTMTLVLDVTPPLVDLFSMMVTVDVPTKASSTTPLPLAASNALA